MQNYYLGKAGSGHIILNAAVTALHPGSLGVNGLKLNEANYPLAWSCLVPTRGAAPKRAWAVPHLIFLHVPLIYQTNFKRTIVF
jgi:hypothetical protein